MSIDPETIEVFDDNAVTTHVEDDDPESLIGEEVSSGNG